MASNLDMLAHIHEVGRWTVNGYPGSSVLVVNPGRDGVNFEKGPTISDYWLTDAVARGYLEWDAPVKTPADGSHAFFGSGSAGWSDGTHRHVRVTEKGRQLLAGADKRCDKDCECSCKL